MLIGIVQFPGSLCQRETKMAVARAGMSVKDIFWHATESEIDACDGYIIVGGFSYQDRIRSGVIAAQSTLMTWLKQQNQKFHKPILGICNGAQILVESGLVPGLPGNPTAMALYDNQRQVEDNCSFYNDVAVIKPLATDANSAFTCAFDNNEAISIPFAHGQGCFKVPAKLLEAMFDANLPLFQYQGKNPNGSDSNLAAVSNFAGNVMAMMPHPERSVAGDKVFQSMRQYILSKPRNVTQPPKNIELLRPSNLAKWQPSSVPSDHTFLVELMIEDNETSTLQLFLSQQGFNVKVKRLTMWQVNACQPFVEVLTQLESTGECFNTHKEHVYSAQTNHRGKLNYLVMDKDNSKLRIKQKHLDSHFKLAIELLNQGQIYIFDGQDQNLSQLADFLLTRQLLFNPYVQDCYEY